MTHSKYHGGPMERLNNLEDSQENSVMTASRTYEKASRAHE